MAAGHCVMEVPDLVLVARPGVMERRAAVKGLMKKPAAANKGVADAAGEIDQAELVLVCGVVVVSWLVSLV